MSVSFLAELIDFVFQFTDTSSISRSCVHLFKIILIILLNVHFFEKLRLYKDILQNCQ